MATLAVGMGTPGVTMAGAGFAPPTSSFAGYFYIAPGDFPSSYYPFFVTGAYAFAFAPAGGVGFPLAAGVAPGPFPVGTMMWVAFTSMVPISSLPPGFSAVVGMPGTFAHSPPILSVATGLGCACGFGVGMAVGIGGVLPGGPKPLSTFGGPPFFPDFLSPVAAVPADYVAGCFISGATVPVELQSFNIE